MTDDKENLNIETSQSQAQRRCNQESKISQANFEHFTTCRGNSRKRRQLSQRHTSTSGTEPRTLNDMMRIYLTFSMQKI